MPGSIIVATFFTSLTGWAATAAAFAINMVASAIISKAFLSPTQPSNNGLSGDSPNPGNPQTLPPATNNKLPVVYGSAWVGGMVTDITITASNQQIYYVLPLCEVTNGGLDTITFGDVYYDGKKVVFDVTNQYQVLSLLDESSGQSQAIDGNLNIYLYSNGSFNPANSSVSAVDLLSDPNLVYTWDSTKQMFNTAFAIVQINYNGALGLTNLGNVKFQITNSRTKPGDCFLDYLQNDVYGAAIPIGQINTDSLDVLNTYSDGSFEYTDANGAPATQPRFQFDGVIDTNRSIMQNLQDMASCCDCLLKYNEIDAQWGVITQAPEYTVAMNLDDSNIISAISISTTDIASAYNIIECKFADQSYQDSFNTSVFDLSQIAPELLYPNEPINKQSISLPLVNNDVRAQYIANRMLEGGREDLVLQVNTGFVGLQLEAGDIVTVTSVNYGWELKLFRINKVINEYAETGEISSKLTLSEFNPAIYDDRDITEFTPAPNTGLSSPITFGTVPVPVVNNQYTTATVPYFELSVTASSGGVIQYAEVWYSAFATPTVEQLIFAGTTAVQSSGTPYAPGETLPAVLLTGISYGDWYFFSRMVNSLSSSSYSSASAVLRWRPATFQYSDRYLVVAYADSITGSSFSLNPRNKSYYGLRNQDSNTPSLTPSDYTWYLADPTFGTVYFLCYSNRTNRRFSFDIGLAAQAAGTGAFVPTLTAQFDPSIWAALQDGINYIDLDFATGQFLTTGTTTVGTGEVLVNNNADGKAVVSLKRFLDFGTGVSTKTASAATITIDIYGRVVGFETPDAFYITVVSFTATASQTVFSVTRGTGYITGQCFVFQNGCLLDTSEYTDAAATVTLSVGATLNNIITVVSFRSYNSSTGYYASFTRSSVSVSNISTYSPAPVSGFELLFINGASLNEQDYDIVAGAITNFPSNMTGLLTLIQWTADNLGVPNGTPVNIVTNTINGQTIYTFSYDPDAFNLWMNGILLKLGTDVTTGSGTYTLTNTPTTSANIMLQQTFSRTGAA